MDSNIITILAVTGGTLTTALLKAWSDRQATQVLKLRHRWEEEERTRNNAKVLDAIADNTKISADAFEVGNNLNEKLLSMDKKLAAVMPDSRRILSDMINLTGRVSQADIAQVIVELQRNAKQQEAYAHENVHRINDILAKIHAAMLKTAAAETQSVDTK